MDSYRVRDYRSYIKYEHAASKSFDTCIAVLSYNQRDITVNLVRFLSQQAVDVLIVDNASSDGTYEAIVDEFGTSVSIVRTVNNLGGAGGFAIGQEWVLHRGYDYCLLTEEDAVPLDNDIVQQMLYHKKPNRIVRARFYELATGSFTLHFSLYPTFVFESIGVMRLELFFRADDLEYAYRVRKLKLEEFVVDRYYSHPILKRGFGVMADYFSLRNGLFVGSVYQDFNQVLITFLKHLVSSVCTLVMDHNLVGVSQFLSATADYFKEEFSRNQIRIQAYKGARVEPTWEYELAVADFSEFFSRFENYSVSSNLLSSNIHLSGYIKKKSIFGKNIIVAKFNGITRVLSLWARNVVFVEELDFLNKRVYYIHKIQQNTMVLRLKFICISILVSFLTVFALPFLYMKYALIRRRVRSN